MQKRANGFITTLLQFRVTVEQKLGGRGISFRDGCVYQGLRARKRVQSAVQKQFQYRNFSLHGDVADGLEMTSTTVLSSAMLPCIH